MENDRRVSVLRAIVSDYVRTKEPVGSRALVERYQLGVSPATIRNDMAALEEGGYIQQPHTSAGRIPTNKGYRLFVDRISSIKPLSPAERRAINQLLEGAVDIDDVLERTVRLLAQLTRQVAVVQYPSVSQSTIRHLELVPLTSHRLLMVVITESGRVDQCTIETTEPLDLGDVAEFRARINLLGIGQRSATLAMELDSLLAGAADSSKPLLQEIVCQLKQIIGPESEERIVVAGTANLARADDDFSNTISPVLAALEEQVVLMKLFSELGQDDLAVKIGSETNHAALAETSLVVSSYGTKEHGVAHLGVVGPTRMDYPNTMAAVRAVARYLTGFIGGEERE